jgi:cytochrome c553
MVLLDPVANPYAPGAGQTPPELAGREAELRQLDVALARLAAGRPARGLVLTGLRGVGKTVLLNAMRSQAMRAGWATGKIEARLDAPLRAPVSTALHTAVREVGGRSRDRHATSRFLAVLKAFSLTASPVGLRLAIDVDAARGRADSGDLEVDLTELFTDAADMAAELGVGVALFVDEMQDVPAQDLVALCGACHEMSQTGRPLLLVGAGLPPLPGVLSAARSYAERLFSYVEIDRLAPAAAERALVAPAAREDVEFAADALAALARLADGYPYFLQAYGKATWDAAAASPITALDVTAGRPDAERELAVGFFGSRYDRATRTERAYMLAMARLGDGPVSTGDVAARLGRTLNGVSPVRDGLIRKGLAYASERGMIAFTVPHFAAFLRDQEEAA